MKTTSSLFALFFSLGSALALAQGDPMGECMANAENASEEYCSCMIAAVESDSDLLAELQSNGGVPAEGEGSDALEDARSNCRAEAG